MSRRSVLGVYRPAGHGALQPSVPRSRQWMVLGGGRLGREPSLLPGVSSAALSWARMVPVLMPILRSPLESSPMSCRAPHGACCLQLQDTCCLASVPGILHAGRNSQEPPWPDPSWAGCSKNGGKKASSYVFPEYSLDFQQLVA